MPRIWQWGLVVIALIALSSCTGSTAPTGGQPPADQQLDYEVTVDAGSSLAPNQVSGMQLPVADALGAGGGGQLPPGFDGVQGLYFTPATAPDSGFSADINVHVERDHTAAQVTDGQLLYLYYNGPGGLMFVDSARAQGGWARFHVTMLGYFIIAENPSLPAPGEAFATFAFADLATAAVGEEINCWAVAINGTAPYAFSWDMGDGTVLSGDQISHAYSDNGEYTIRVATSDAQQHTATAFSTPVTVTGGGITDLTVVVTAEQDPDNPLHFTYGANVAGGVPPYGYSWDVDGDGSEDSSSPQFEYTYPGPGLFPIRLGVTDDGGNSAEGDSAADARSLMLSAAPLSGLAPFDTEFTIDAEGFSAGDELTLDFGDTQSEIVTVISGQTAYQVMHTYSAGSFMAMATGVSAVGGQAYSLDSNTVSLAVVARPDKPVLQLTQPLLPGPEQTFSIAGFAFGASQGGRTVMLDSDQLQVVSWADTAVEVEYPGGFNGASGALTVVDPTAGASNPLRLTVDAQTEPMGIQNVLPLSPEPGGRVLIIGHGFGFVEMTVEVGGVPATVVEWNNNEIVALLSTTVATGPRNLVVETGAGAPDLTTTIDVADPGPIPYPVLNGAAPMVQEIGTGGSMELAGLNFSDGYGGLVFGCGQVLPVSAWASTQITVGDPPDSVDRGVVVIARDLPSNPLTASYLYRPQIDSLEPAYGAVGDSISINGSHFGSQQATDQVLLGGAALTISAWSDTQIGVVLPAGVSDGDIIVLKALSSNGVAFDVVPPPPDTPGGQQL